MESGTEMEQSTIINLYIPIYCNKIGEENDFHRKALAKIPYAKEIYSEQAISKNKFPVYICHDQIDRDNILCPRWCTKVSHSFNY